MQPVVFLLTCDDCCAASTCTIEQCDGDGDSGGDDDDDSLEDDEDEDKVLEEDNGSGLEVEEEEEQQDPLQEDHVDVTNLLHVLNRSVTPPLPPDC